MTNLVPTYRVENDDFKVEFEVLTPIDVDDLRNPEKREIALAIQDLDVLIDACEIELQKMDVEINRLTNHADGLDYAISVASGIITGLVDSIFVGEMDIKSATKEAEEKIADKVKEKALKEKQDATVQKAIANAKKKGKKLSKEEIEKIKDNVKKKFYSDPNNIAETGNDPVLKRAIKYLEDNHPTPQDNLYKGTGSSPATHHLDDIAHHASIAGMIASIVVQFFRVATFVNKDGKWKLKFAKTDPKELTELWLPIIISGLLNWLVYMAEKSNKTAEEEKLPEPIFKIAHVLASAPAIIQIIKAIDNWCLHLYSDVAGSKNSKGRGAGIPGLFISMLKEISSVPPLNLTGLPKFVEHLYKDKKIDIRTEMGIAKELGRQAIPVIINEVLVRTFYFVRHLVSEYKKQDSFNGINWDNVIPFGNRTVERMMTIATGTFTAVDIADAAIRSGGFNPACLLRVNFVGVGRFAVAIVVDTSMGIKRNQLLNKRIQIMSEQLALLNAKVSYKCAAVDLELVDVAKSEEEMWVAAESTEKTLIEVYEVAEESVDFLHNSLIEIQQNFEKISQYRGSIEEKNPGLVKDLINITKWGKK